MQRQPSWGEKRKPPESQQNKKARRWRRLRIYLAVGTLLTFGIIASGWYMFSMPGQSFDPANASQPDETTVAERWPEQLPVAETNLADELSEYVVHLAEEIGERNLGRYDNLCETADFLEEQLSSFGYSVSRQEFEVRGLDCFNIIAERKGSSRPKEILIVGAHYDSVEGSPGANDNATGVASMLALAKKISPSNPDRTIRFVGFTNEEPPYFQNIGEMGSTVYARQCRESNDSIVGVLSLETMGYFSNEPNSQNYPPPLSLMYPSTGNFIGFVGNLESREFLHRVVKSFRENAGIPSEAACLPGVVQGVGWSDHWSFWQEGYAGIMVTDTAPFRYPHYHLATDTPDKIDFESLAKVVEGLECVIEDLVTVAPVGETSTSDNVTPNTDLVTKASKE